MLSLQTSTSETCCTFNLRITIGSPCRCSACSWAHNLGTFPQKSRNLVPPVMRDKLVIGLSFSISGRFIQITEKHHVFRHTICGLCGFSPFFHKGWMVDELSRLGVFLHPKRSFLENQAENDKLRLRLKV